MIYGSSPPVSTISLSILVLIIVCKRLFQQPQINHSGATKG